MDEREYSGLGQRTEEGCGAYRESSMKRLAQYLQF